MGKLGFTTILMQMNFYFILNQVKHAPFWVRVNNAHYRALSRTIAHYRALSRTIARTIHALSRTKLSAYIVNH